MELRFIDNNHSIDHQSRKLIRSHVMKRKNMGKTIPARGYKGCDRRQSLHVTSHPPQRIVLADGTKRKDNAVAEVENALQHCLGLSAERTAMGRYTPCSSFTGAEYDYFAFPIQFTPSMRYLVHQFNSSICETLYPHEFCRPSRETGFPWFQYMLTDEAFLHCILVITGSYVSQFRGYDDETLETARHCSQTLRLVNRDLSTAVVPQDTTFAVVVSLTIQANISGDVQISRIHLEGLQRMVALRSGGLAKLRDCNMVLTQKICRADNEFALLEGTTTRFGPDLETIKSTMLAPLYWTSEIPKLSYPLQHLSTPLQHLTQDVLALCQCPGKTKLEFYQYQDIIICICQRTLDFAPLAGVRPLDPLDDAWQLGLLAFMTTIMYHLQRMRYIYRGVLPKALRGRLEKGAFLRADGYQSVRLWLFYVYGLIMIEGSDGDWIVSKIRELLTGLEIKTWEGAKRHLSLFPWIGILHDTNGKKLWDLVMLAPTAIEKMR